MALVERTDELAALNRLLAACVAGKGSLAVVSGPAGTGKTELLHTFAEHAAQEGALFLNAVGSAAERVLPFGVLGQLSRCAAVSAEITERAARLLDASIFATIISRPDDEGIVRLQGQVVQRLCADLLSMADRSPILIGIDDFEHVDAPSRQFLLHIVRRLRSGRILVLVNQSTFPSPTYSTYQSELVRQPYCHRISLGPLSMRGVAEMLAQDMGEEAARQNAAAYYAASGGNPLLVCALIRDRRSMLSAGSAQLAAAAAYGQAVMACLHRCAPAVLQVARGLAVLGEHGSSPMLSQLLGIDPDSVALGLRELAAVGLLVSGHFGHPAAPQAVLDAMPSQDRIDLHQRAAKLLYNAGSAAALIAGHLVASGTAHDPWAVAKLQEAAEQALADDQAQRAIDCLKLAYRAGVTESEQARTTMMLARIEWRTDPLLVLRHLPFLATSLRHGLLRGDDAVTTIRYFLWHGWFDEAAQALEQLFSSVEKTKGCNAAELSTVRMYLSCSFPLLAPQASQDAGLPLAGEVATGASRTWLHATTAITAAMRRGAAEEAVIGAEQVLQSARLSDATIEPLEFALLALIYADRVDRAAIWCDALLHEAAQRCAPWWQALLSSVRSHIALRRGDLSVAKQSAEAALTHVSQASWGVAVGAPLGGVLLAATAMGLHGDAATLLRQPVPEAMFQTRYGLPYLHARGHYYLATDRVYAAVDDFLACGQLATRLGLDSPAVAPWRSDAAEAYLRLDRHDLARELIAEQLSRLDASASRARGISLRLLAATSEREHRAKMLRQSVEMLQACGDRLQLARALADLSHAHHEAGESARARTMIRRAWGIAEESGSEELRRAFLRDRGDLCSEVAADRKSAESVTALSDAERRVGALAALGHTNRAIASKLYITPSTVEQHLTRVYRKLNVGCRQDLPADLLAEFAETGGGLVGVSRERSDS
jgi:DNA-binding CsgD family transcriptional regulator